MDERIWCVNALRVHSPNNLTVYTTDFKFDVDLMLYNGQNVKRLSGWGKVYSTS